MSGQDTVYGYVRLLKIGDKKGEKSADILLQRSFSNDNTKFSNTLLNKSMFNCTRHLVNFLEIDNLNIYFRSQLNKNSQPNNFFPNIIASIPEQSEYYSKLFDILEFQHRHLRTVFFIYHLCCHKNHTKKHAVITSQFYFDNIRCYAELIQGQQFQN